MSVFITIDGKREEFDDSFRNLSPEEQDAAVAARAASKGIKAPPGIVINIDGKLEKFPPSFKDLSPEEQDAAVEARAAERGISPDDGGHILGFLNKGLAQGTGGLLNAGGYQFGAVSQIRKMKDLISGKESEPISATEDIKGLYDMLGVPYASRDAETTGEHFQEGVGEGLPLILPFAKMLQVAKGMTHFPRLASWADDALAGLASKTGIVIEGAAAGVSNVAGEAVKDTGGGPSAEMAARMLAPIGAVSAIPLTMSAGGAALRGVDAVAPRVGEGIRAGGRIMTTGQRFALNQLREIRRGLTPITEEGARQVAAARVREVVGGDARMKELAAQVDPDHPEGLTAAEQTGDDVLLGMQRALAREDPNAREMLESQQTEALEQLGGKLINVGGNTRTAQDWLKKRLAAVSANMMERVDRVMATATKNVEKQGSRFQEEDISDRVVHVLKAEYDAARLKEKEIWAKIPMSVKSNFAGTKEVVQDIIETTPRARRKDVDREIRSLIGSKVADEEEELLARVFGDEPPDPEAGPRHSGFWQGPQSVREMHGLSSHLRDVAADALARNVPKRPRARVANLVADAILDDLGVFTRATEHGRLLGEALAYTRALHETFSTGATGKILAVTYQGRQKIDSSTALRTTLRDGPAGQEAAHSIISADKKAAGLIEEFLRGRFVQAAISETGDFSFKGANNWLRQNRALLEFYPDMKATMKKAATSRRNAERFAQRAATRRALAETDTAASRFAFQQPEKAAMSIFAAENPVAEARSLMQSARKDPTGKTVEGIRKATAEWIFRGGIRSNGLLAGKKLRRLLGNPDVDRALNVIYTQEQRKRIDTIVDTVAKFDPVKEQHVSKVLPDKSSPLLRFIVGNIGANVGSYIGRDGAQLRTANKASTGMERILDRLTNKKAMEILTDSIPDAKLFKSLLEVPETFTLTKSQQTTLAPYGIGAAASALADQEDD